MKRDKESTAFAHRDLRVVWELYAKTLQGDETRSVNLVSFVSDMAEHLQPVEAVCKSSAELPMLTPDPAYVDAELDAASYPTLVFGANYPRLQGVKQKYDPSDLFRYPQSVKLKPSRSVDCVYKGLPNKD